MAAPLTVGLPDALSSRCQDAGAPLSGHRHLKPQWEVAIVSTTAGSSPIPPTPHGHRRRIVLISLTPLSSLLY